MADSSKITIDITGMTCAACEARVQKSASAVGGVECAAVNLLKNSMELTFDGSPETLRAVCEAIEKAGYGATPRATSSAASTTSQAVASEQIKESASKAVAEMRFRLVVSMAFSIPLFYVAMGPMFGWPEIPGLAGMQGMGASALTQLLLCIPILVVNRRTFVAGATSLIHLSPNMDSLIAIGSGASVAYSTVALYRMAFAAGVGDVEAVHAAAHSLYFDSAGMILALIALGKFFEARAKGRTTSAITSLMDLAPKVACVVRDGQEQHLPVEEVRVGDRVIVRTGEAVPVDGVVVEGFGSIDESAITGEPVPREKSQGDSVIGATIVRSGWLAIEAVAVGEDTTLAGVIRLVDEATSSKAPIERMADRIAGVFVPVVIGLAAATFIGWLAFFAPGDVASALSHAVSVLVISCPCALGLATPTAIMVGTGRGAANGILIKSAEALETTHSVSCVVLDKTGTITEGAPKLSDVVPREGVAADELLRLAAALERKSEHPLAKAIVSFVDEMHPGLDATTTVEEFTQVAGAGLSARVDGRMVLGGNARLMEAQGLDISCVVSLATDLASLAKTPLFFAADGSLLGIIAVADAIKPTSAQSVARLRAMGIHTLLLTGDQARTAKAVAREVDVDEVVSDVLPAQKEEKVRELQARGERVAMVGDGINDAPALVRADVGIAIGAGSDIALDSADIVLMKSDPADIASAIELSRATMRTIKQNLFWALFYNCICIPIAMGVLTPFGITLDPMIGAAAMGFSSVFVVSNALRLKRWKPSVASSCHATTHTPPTSSKHGPSGTPVAEAERKITMERKLNIEGMMCEHCVAHVREALEALEGVESVQVSLDSASATLEAPASVSDAELIAAVEAAGYKAQVA